MFKYTLQNVVLNNVEKKNWWSIFRIKLYAVGFQISFYYDSIMDVLLWVQM